MMSIKVEALRASLNPPHEMFTLSTATAFVVSHRGDSFLITNWHVVTSLDPVTRKPTGSSAAMPSHLRLWLSDIDPEQPGSFSWRNVDIPLYQGGQAQWFRHPSDNDAIDVVAVPLPPVTHLQSMHHDARNLQYHAYTVDEPTDPPRLVPTEDLSIIGFPFGIAAGGYLGVWSRGTLASEPTIDFGGLPCLLIDSRTREGQSGSPVIRYWPAGNMKVTRGGISMGGAEDSWSLIGVYSGRISAQSDLGRVWKRSIIRETVEGQRQDMTTFD